MFYSNEQFTTQYQNPVIGTILFLIYHFTNLLIFPNWLINALGFLAFLSVYPFYSIVSKIQEIRADGEAFQATGNIDAVKDYLGGLKKNKESFWLRCIILIQKYNSERRLQGMNTRFYYISHTRKTQWCNERIPIAHPGAIHQRSISEFDEFTSVN